MNQRRPRKRRALGAGLAVVLLALFMLAPGMAIAESESDSATVDESAPARSSVMERWRKASPAERAEMRERLRDRMRDATPRQRRRIERRMRRLARALPDFTPIERLILLRAAAVLRVHVLELSAIIAHVPDMVGIVFIHQVVLTIHNSADAHPEQHTTHRHVRLTMGITRSEEARVGKEREVGG